MLMLMLMLMMMMMMMMVPFEHIGSCDCKGTPNTRCQEGYEACRFAHRAVEDGKGLPGRIRIGRTEASAGGFRPMFWDFTKKRGALKQTKLGFQLTKRRIESRNIGISMASSYLNGD